MTLADRIRPGSLRARLLAANVALALLVLIVFGLVAVAVVSLRSASVKAEHTARTIAAANALEKSLIDLETGARGYALTRRPRFLQPWSAARAQLPVERARLRRDVAGAPAQARIVAEIEREINDYETAYSVPFIRSVQRSGLDEAARVARTGAGKRRVDRIRRNFATLLNTQRAQSRQRTEDAARSRTLALIAIGVGVLLLLGFVIFQQLALRRWLLIPLDRLGAAAERLGAGDLSARTELHGDDEVTHVGEAFDTMAAALEARSADLERSNAELEEFAYVASHDLAEPLRAMGGYADLLGRRYGDQLDERAERYISGITGGAERMRGLIDDLLAYSRAGRRDLDMRPVDMAVLLEGVRADLTVAIREAGADVRVDGELPTVVADQSQIRMVLQNLLANAIKFRGEDPPQIVVSAEESGADWRFRVADNGIGIEAHHADRIFRMFQRLHTREEFDGSGIGLALCERILARHGGKIWVEPGDGRGSVFSFTLPMNQS